MIITMADVQRAGHCASGARRWFEGYALDFRDFLKHGIDVETFLATGSQYAIDIVNLKRERQKNG